MEQTVVLIKPDAIKKKLVGEITKRFEGAGFKLVACKMVQLTDELLDIWYSHHKDKPFFPSLCSFMKETAVVAQVWEGESVVAKVRDLIGPTDSRLAPKGTIRGDFGGDNQKNIIHASDSPETAEKEKSLIFRPEELFLTNKSSLSNFPKDRQQSF